MRLAIAILFSIVVWLAYFASILFWMWLLDFNNHLLPEWAKAGCILIAGICDTAGLGLSIAATIALITAGLVARPEVAKLVEVGK